MNIIIKFKSEERAKEFMDYLSNPGELSGYAFSTKFNCNYEESIIEEEEEL